MLLALNWLLLWKQPDVASFLQLNLTKPISLHIGWLSVLPLAMDPSSMMWPQTSALTSSSSSAAITDVGLSTAACSPSDLNEWQRPYVLWARSLPNWTSPILDWTGHDMFTDLEPSFEPGTMKTQTPHESGPSLTSQSCKPWHNACRITLNRAAPRPSWTSVSLASSSWQVRPISHL